MLQRGLGHFLQSNLLSFYGLNRFLLKRLRLFYVWGKLFFHMLET